MENREMLELAAKAAGYTVNARMQAKRYAIGAGDAGLWIDGVNTCWNPLTNDADALRLAVKLSLSIFPPVQAQGDFAVASIEAQLIDEDGNTWIQEPIKDDGAIAATRRAIVRAAAEVGRVTINQSPKNKD